MIAGPINIGAVKKDHRRFMEANRSMVMREMRKAGEVAVRVAKIGAGQVGVGLRVRTGKLRKATKYKVIQLAGGARVRVSNAVKYAPYLEFGTKAHVIEAKNAKALRFMFPQFSGKYIYRKRVMHPGNPAYKWLWTGVNDAWIFLRVRLLHDMKVLASQF